MKIITKESKIASVADRWKKQYSHGDKWDTYLHSRGRTAREIWKQLKSLRPGSSEDDIQEIIGNRSWTSIECDECGMECDLVVRLGRDLDYAEHTAEICIPCLERARQIAKESKG